MSKYDEDFGKVSDEEMEKAFAYSNFGYRDLPKAEKLIKRRHIIQQGVLKTQTNYHNGHTMKMILIELGLITSKLHVTVKGRRFLFDAFYCQKTRV